MKKFTALCLIALTLTFLPACSTTSQREKVPALAKIAALVGTTEALREHPNWRDGFTQAASDLEHLANTPQINVAEIMAIIQRLPIKELKSQRATLYITSAAILIQEAGGVAVPLENYGQLKEVAQALAAGIRLALE